MSTVTIQLPDRLKSRLESEAKRSGTSPSRIVREALQARLSVTNTVRTPAPSLGDLMADLAGTGRGRHTDLSCNKKHLEDFGR